MDIKKTNLNERAHDERRRYSLAITVNTPERVGEMKNKDNKLNINYIPIEPNETFFE